MPNRANRELPRNEKNCELPNRELPKDFYFYAKFIEKFIKSCKRLVVYYLVLFYRTEIALI